MIPSASPTISPPPTVSAQPTAKPTNLLMTVSTFEEFEAAVQVDGAVVDVVSNLTFDGQLTIAFATTIHSSINATLSGGGATRFFHVDDGVGSICPG